MKMRAWSVPALVLLLATSSFADFRYEETTKITGGAIVGMMKFAGAFSRDAKQAMEPVTSTVLVKGNRMARINPSSTEIIDLDKETITRIDHQNKTYTVMTFEQMKQQMQEAQQRARQEARQQPPSEQQPSQPPQLTFKATVKNTGVSKSVAGLDASEEILAMTLEGTDQKTGQNGGMAITNDMWMAPEIPGYEEVREFNRRLAAKVGMMFADAFKPLMANMQPGSGEAMGEMAKEMSKLKGIPVQQIMRMGATANGQPLPAASEAPLPQSHGPSAGEVAQQGAASAITSKLGRFGGFGGFGGRRHKGGDSEPSSQSQANADKAQSVLLESSTELTSFSSAPLDDARFSVPAGYTQVMPQSSGR
jgi:cell pole-organizing protein PopZ